MRGFNDPIKIKEVIKVVARKNIGLMGLFETRVRQQNAAKVTKKFGGGTQLMGSLLKVG